MRMFIKGIFLIFVPVIVFGKDISLPTTPSKISPQEARQKLSELKIDYSPAEFINQIRNNKIENVKLFVYSGVNLNFDYPDKEGTRSTPLIVAAQEGYNDIISFLIENGADVNHQSKFSGNHALGCAAQKGHLDTIKLLISKGADVNVENRDGRTPLMKASIQGNLDIVKILLEKGANPNILDRNKKSAFVYAQEFKQPEIAQLLENKRK